MDIKTSKFVRYVSSVYRMQEIWSLHQVHVLSRHVEFNPQSVRDLKSNSFTKLSSVYLYYNPIFNIDLQKNLFMIIFSRFQDFSEAASISEKQYPVKGRQYPLRSRWAAVKSTVGSVWNRCKKACSVFKSSTDTASKFHSLTELLGKESIRKKKFLESLKGKVLDPQEPFLQWWNKVFVLSCVIAVSLDPLFFYIPVLDAKQMCLNLDGTLKVTACVLRSSVDIFYIIHIIFQFHTGYIDPASCVFGRGDLIKDPSAIAKRYVSSYFIIDILSILPLPQASLLFITPLKLKGPVPLVTKEWMKYATFFQYIPRLIRIRPLWKQVTSTTGMFTETAWAGAVFNLFLYMLASHVVGAFWYLFSIERAHRCWRGACKKTECDYKYLYCGEHRPETSFLKFLNASCPLIEQSGTRDTSAFDFGIFLDALQSHVTEYTDFGRKFSYCFWWGLRALSSLGQNLQTSTFIGEIVFAVSIAVFGLGLLTSLIGNMQRYLQSTTVRVEEMRVSRQDAEQWMAHRTLPEKLRERIRRYEQFKWQVTRGVQEEKLIQNLPKDLRRDIRRHLFLKLLMHVPFFAKMDDQLLNAMCDHLKPVLYTEKSFVLREDDTVDEMLFIMRGSLQTSTTNRGKTGFFNSDYLKAGDFCGEELLAWALHPQPSSHLPASTRTVEALTQVEAFALKSDDLRIVASQFQRLRDEQLQQAFRFYSQQWRTWAACKIQEAWRRYRRRKHEKSLREAENRLRIALTQDTGASALSIGATFHASRFAARLLRIARHNSKEKARFPKRSRQRLPPKKPDEPNFAANRKHISSPYVA